MEVRAQLSVKKGPIWPGGLNDIVVRLEGSTLNIELLDISALGLLQRGAIKRLFGSEALEAAASGVAPALRIEVAEAQFEFPSSRLNKASILVELTGRPQFAINFLDLSSIETRAATRPNPVGILKDTATAAKGAGDAHELREIWRVELERVGA